MRTPNNILVITGRLFDRAFVDFLTWNRKLIVLRIPLLGTIDDRLALKDSLPIRLSDVNVNTHNVIGLDFRGNHPPSYVPEPVTLKCQLNSSLVTDSFKQGLTR